MSMVTSLRVSDEVKARFGALLWQARDRGNRVTQSDLIDRLVAIAGNHDDELWSGTWSPPTWAAVRTVLDALPDAGPRTDAGNETFA